MVPYVRDSFFSGRQFTDLAAMRTQAASWSLAVAGQRSARPLAGARPEVVFKALEQQHLLALPRRPFEAATWQTAKVSPDCHICVGGALYSVPFRLIGARLDVRTTEGMLFAYAGHELVKTHVRVGKGRRSTDWQDYPEAKAAFFMRTPSWCRHRAGEIGPATTALVAGLLGEQALHRLRSAQGVVHLVDSYGAERLRARLRSGPRRRRRQLPHRQGHPRRRPRAACHGARAGARQPPPTCTDPRPSSPTWRPDHGDPSARS